MTIVLSKEQLSRISSKVDRPVGMTKKQRVLQHIQSRGRVRTSDIIRFGSMIFSNRALRDAQQLVEDGKIFRMRHDLKEKLYGEMREDIFTSSKEDA